MDTDYDRIAEPTVAFPAGRAYGFSRRVEGELVEGAPIVLEFFLPEGSFEVMNYYQGRGCAVAGLEGRSAVDIAASLGVRPAGVRIANSRVLHR
jgi:hypothetical protein